MYFLVILSAAESQKICELFLFFIAGVAAERQLKQRVNTFQMGNLTHYQHTVRNGVSVETKVDAPYARLRKGLLGVYGITLILFVSVLVLLVVLAPLEQYWISTRV